MTSYPDGPLSQNDEPRVDVGARYAITVRFALRKGGEPHFLSLIKENAAASVRDEPGCLQFDVLMPLNGSADEPYVLLYEVYSDRAAFDAHVATPHYQAFDDASRSLITRKDVVEFATFGNRK
jgi:quinol monooxygenase YgiN